MSYFRCAAIADRHRQAYRTLVGHRQPVPRRQQPGGDAPQHRRQSRFAVQRAPKATGGTRPAATANGNMGCGFLELMPSDDVGLSAVEAGARPGRTPS
jgi:hypothetical protein